MSERARIMSSVGKITTVLKVAVDSVTLELCDSRNYFAIASPVLVETID